MVSNLVSCQRCLPVSSQHSPEHTCLLVALFEPATFASAQYAYLLGEQVLVALQLDVDLWYMSGVLTDPGRRREALTPAS
jgi:hypothetical protein